MIHGTTIMRILPKNTRDNIEEDGGEFKELFLQFLKEGKKKSFVEVIYFLDNLALQKLEFNFSLILALVSKPYRPIEWPSRERWLYFCCLLAWPKEISFYKFADYPGFIFLFLPIEYPPSVVFLPSFPKITQRNIPVHIIRV